MRYQEFSVYKVELVFQVQVTEDLPTGARSDAQAVTVTVLDKNDNTPSFLVANLTTEITAGDYSVNRILLTDVSFIVHPNFQNYKFKE